MKHKSLLAITIGIFFCVNIYSQSSTFEIGPRISGFESIGAIYKMKRSSGNYLRIRTALASGSTRITNIQRTANSSVGFAVGIEKRSKLNESLVFYRGFEPQARFGLQFSLETRFSVELGLGYVLGLAYEFNDEFYVSFEAIPSIVGRYSSLGNQEYLSGLNVGFDSNSVALSVVHRFEFSK